MVFLFTVIVKQQYYHIHSIHDIVRIKHVVNFVLWPQSSHEELHLNSENKSHEYKIYGPSSKLVLNFVSAISYRI